MIMEKLMYISTPNVPDIVDAIERLEVQKNETVIILFAEQELPDIPLLISELNKRKIDFFGAVFPGIIHGSERHHSGAIINTLPIIEKPFLIKDISRLPAEFEELAYSFRTLDGKKLTTFIIVDYTASKIPEFLSSLFNMFADSIEYLGCGAGSLEGGSTGPMFTPQGIFEDAAIISFIDMECRLGVRHGWKKAAGPLVVTKCDEKVIKELNWKNAFEVYKETIEAFTGKTIDENDHFEVLKHYPLGIYMEGHEDLVRDVMEITEEGELVCAGGIPENAVLNILTSDKTSLLRSAKTAIDDCFVEEREDIEGCFIIDCVSRSIFLQEGFEDELQVIKNRLENRDIQIIPEGVLSVGEIASMGKDTVEFFNKTVVIGIFHE
ncbi:FIST C-terminal domain-containing protein [Methanolobus sp. WCC4]|uniref:FIST signal transduction protein n=1 Tax=Methanolobus sp. WCC4 TaxID=3125784 RepID=UPI0030FA0D5E